MGEDAIGAFFKRVVNKDKEIDSFVELVYVVGISEWHLTPAEIGEIEVPLLFRLLDNHVRQIEKFKKK